MTGRKPVWWSSWCSSWDRGDRARAGAPKSALRNYPVPLLRPASRPRGRCKVAKDQNNRTCQKKTFVQISIKTFSSKNISTAQVNQGGSWWRWVYFGPPLPGQGPSVYCGEGWICKNGLQAAPPAWRTTAPGTELGQVSRCGC